MSKSTDVPKLDRGRRSRGKHKTPRRVGSSRLDPVWHDCAHCGGVGTVELHRVTVGLYLGACSECGRCYAKLRERPKG